MTDLNNDICSICLDTESTQLKTCKWTCNHLFHEHCVSMWTNGCPICRNNILISPLSENGTDVDTEENGTGADTDQVSWSISRNPHCPMDIPIAIHMHNHVPLNFQTLYRDEWKDRDCIDTNHQMRYLQIMHRVISICTTCKTYQSSDIKYDI
jgi:hypothetical protein